jgi:hypothetical protein
LGQLSCSQAKAASSASERTISGGSEETNLITFDHKTHIPLPSEETVEQDEKMAVDLEVIRRLERQVHVLCNV